MSALWTLDAMTTAMRADARGHFAVERVRYFYR